MRSNGHRPPPTFPPIAIVGRGCVLPGALTPDELWSGVAAGADSLTSVPAGAWRVSPERVVPPAPERETASDRGGYIRGFAQAFDPAGFALPPETIRGLDPSLAWLLHASRTALREAGHTTRAGADRVGAVLGSLLLPTIGLSRYAESVWFEGADGVPGMASLGREKPDPRHRFMSGLPIHLLAEALGVGGRPFALDAACASSLYAIRYACDALHDWTTDLMLAGAVNGTDPLFLNTGFRALQALSPSGRSRPFHREADGLVPSQGAAVVVLKRLEDAVAAGDRIWGVIRGVGLSNDGGEKGLLVPAPAGQERAMRQAFSHSGLRPEDISLMECHATGTPVGDGAEIRSAGVVYGGVADLPIGSLKSNLGHTLTASGAAGLLKVLGAMEAGIRPATLHADDRLPEIADSPFRLLEAAERWEAPEGRRAAVSSFGFGGNNAHLLVEEWTGERAASSFPSPEPTRPAAEGVDEGDEIAEGEEIAIVALSVVAAAAPNRNDFARALLDGISQCSEVDASGLQGRIESIPLELDGLRFPPADLGESLPQQVLLLHAARAAIAEAGELPASRTGVFVGMQCDPEVARHMARVRVAEWAPAWANRRAALLPEGWVTAAQSSFAGPLTPQTVLGSLPNVVANRVSTQFGFEGPGLVFSAEELSGIAALEVALRGLRTGELDAAVVGAVDLCCEAVHVAASQAVLDEDRQIPGDAAVVLVLKRMADAHRDGDTVLATIPGRLPAESDSMLRIGGNAGFDLTPLFGHAHAASGLLQVAAAALCCAAHARPGRTGAIPWLTDGEVRSATVTVRALGGPSSEITLQEVLGAPPLRVDRGDRPALERYGAPDRASLLAMLVQGRPGGDGPVTLVLAALSAEELDKQREGAIAFLEGRANSLPDGAFLRDAPVEGELAFVFTGAGAAYSGMGRELVVALPELLAKVAPIIPRLRSAASWVYGAPGAEPPPLAKLTGSSFLAQFHAKVSREVLGLNPTAALGLSSGETNSIAALGAWDDLDGLLEGLVETGMYSRELGGEYRALERAWGEAATWAGWRVLLPVETVEAALADEPRVFLTMRQGPTDCVIGGETAACDRVIARLGVEDAYPLGYDLAVHCPILAEVEESWHALHHRPTHPVPDTRFYSSGALAAYEASADAVADALTGMARVPVDFPAMIERAWEDGVRIFLEQGPRELCTRWIREVLGERPHLALSLDRPGVPAKRQLLHVAAELLAAGVPIQVSKLLSSLDASADPEPRALKARSFPSHAPPVQLPAIPGEEERAMARAPRLPSVMAEWDANWENGALRSNGRVPVTGVPRATAVPAMASAVTSALAAVPTPASTAPGSAPPAPTGTRPRDRNRNDARASALQAKMTAVSESHRGFLEAQAKLHRQFLRLQADSVQQLTGMPLPPAALLQPTPERPPTPVASPAPRIVTPATPEELRAPSPPLFDRADLEELASGKISAHFGPLFEVQDAYPRQVRMPMPPLLLADRVLAIEGEPGSMGTGRIITETDVTEDAWYLYDGRMPAGIQVEAGQADLLLCSWLGADLLNRGERVYRLLGCELTFHGGRPEPGETLQYDIRLDRHARTGDVRLFFFSYTSSVDGDPRLTVQGGHAGFFTDEELRGSGGVIWDPAAEEPEPPANAAPARLATSRTAFAPEAVRAFAEGRPFDCFGAGFELAAAHVRSPRLQSGPMLLMDEVTALDPTGGPWGRGYLRAVRSIRQDDWFFPGHFKDDPTMPGTLMYEGGLQAMAFYLAAHGYTIDRDGWRFEPVTDVPYAMVCRGQVVPTSKEIVYELFVHGIEDGEVPILWADILLSADGLKAFHCKRMGIRLVPDWPLEAQPELRHPEIEEGAASVDGFSFGYDSLLNCAWGKPSLAFGPAFERFDSQRRLPRLPGPPYHFMSRVTAVTGEMGVVASGASVEVEYDIPPDAWYFADSPGGTMPFCVLMEAALQPCGWLTAFMGIPLVSDTDLRFRNLNGDGTVLGEIHPEDGPLRTVVTCTDVSRSGETFIESFDVRCSIGEREVFSLKTTFGHFPAEALAAQVGVPFTAEEREALETEASDFFVDLRARRAESSSVPGPTSRFGLGHGRLGLLTRVTGYWPEGSRGGKARLRAEMEVDPAAWFFSAHFFQDPVQPGSLGVEAMIQLLQFYMEERGMDEGMMRPRFEALEVDRPHSWRYRGQVIPTNRMVWVELEVTEEGRDARGPFAVADAWLWVDGKRIYSAKGLGMRIVEEGPTDGKPVETAGAAPDGMAAEPRSAPESGLTAESEAIRTEETLDPAVDRWLLDHRPTYTLPALPLTFMADRMAAAAQALHPELVVIAIEDLEVKGWLVCDGPRRLRTEVEVHASGDGSRERSEEGSEPAYDVRLLAWRESSVSALSRFEPVATARIVLGRAYAAAPAALAPLPSAEPAPDPYESGALIHGPDFQLLGELRIGPEGSTATLDAGGRRTPPGLLNPLLLDGVTHAIPNAELWQWSEEIGRDRVAYPTKILSASFHGPTPRSGDVRCEVRFDGFLGDRSAPRFQIQLLVEDRCWAELQLVAGLHPKGPIGMLPGTDRRSFLLDRKPIPGAGLSQWDGTETRLLFADMAASDWLPGTLNHLYGSKARGADLALEIAIQEHVARTVGVHPGTVGVDAQSALATCPALPYSRFPVVTREVEGGVAVRDASPEQADFSPAHAYWQERLEAARWPVEDMYFAMAEKFVRRVVLEDPEAFARIRGRSAVFVANHQVAVESFLFALLTPGLTGVPSVVLAKSEVRTRWLDEFLTLAEAYPGVRLPEFIIYLEQKKPLQVLQTFKRCREQMTREGLSALVHVEGTRSLACRSPVTVISSSLIDMAMGADAPIVPVRFVGGLPVEPLESRRHIPVGHGTQDYYYGTPIFPEELESIPYAERRQRVLSGINALGPGMEEVPNPPDADFEASVHEWMEGTGVDEEYSILLRALQRLRDPGDEMRHLLSAVDRGSLELEKGPLGEWTAELGRRLFGPRGPSLSVGKVR